MQKIENIGKGLERPLKEVLVTTSMGQNEDEGSIK